MNPFTDVWCTTFCNSRDTTGTTEESRAFLLKKRTKSQQRGEVASAPLLESNQQHHPTTKKRKISAVAGAATTYFYDDKLPDDEDRDQTIGPYDVLCGRHRLAFNNVGNRRFRLTVPMFVDRYTKTPDRKGKTRLINEIRELISDSCGGRFLQNRNGRWVELNKNQAREKVGHALRDTAALAVKSSKSMEAGYAKQLFALEQAKLSFASKQQKNSSYSTHNPTARTSSTTTTRRQQQQPVKKASARVKKNPKPMRVLLPLVGVSTSTRCDLTTTEAVAPSFNDQHAPSIKPTSTLWSSCSSVDVDLVFHQSMFEEDVNLHLPPTSSSSALVQQKRPLSSEDEDVLHLPTSMLKYLQKQEAELNLVGEENLLKEKLKIDHQLGMLTGEDTIQLLEVENYDNYDSPTGLDDQVLLQWVLGC